MLTIDESLTCELPGRRGVETVNAGRGSSPVASMNSSLLGMKTSI
jgi:hypothetical protein